jgi:hypothetical protein
MNEGRKGWMRKCIFKSKKEKKEKRKKVRKIIREKTNLKVVCNEN